MATQIHDVKGLGILCVNDELIQPTWLKPDRKFNGLSIDEVLISEILKITNSRRNHNDSAFVLWSADPRVRRIIGMTSAAAEASALLSLV